MTRQESLQRACNELGIQIEIPFTLLLESRRQIVAQALLPQLGAEKGMIIVKKFEDLCGGADEIIRRGYGYSVLDDPRQEFDLNSYIAMFSDWGWAKVDEIEPEWMR